MDWTARFGAVMAIQPAAAASNPVVVLETQIGANRVVEMLSGEQLPRIC